MKTDLFFNRLGFNPDLTTRQSRVDSVSIASRYRVLATLLLCLTLFVGSGNAWGAVNNGDLFERISAAPAANDEVIFVKQDGSHACGTTQNTNNRSTVTITTSSNQYIYNSSNNVQVFVVKVNSSNYGFHTGSGYIYSASSSSNNLKTNSTAASTAPSGTAAWTLSFSSSVLSARNVSNTSYYLEFNTSSALFSQYKSTQQKPYLYKKVMSAPTAVAASSITTNSATITITDATNVNYYELYYSTSSTVPTASSSATTIIENGKSKSITGLTVGTSYYVWARAYTTSPSRKTGWVALTGNYFTTLSASCSSNPSIGNASINGSFTLSSVPFSCTVSSEGGDGCSIDDAGFVWKSGSDPSASDNKTAGTYSTNITGSITGSFSTGTTYYVKAYATNDNGTTLSATSYQFRPQSISFNGNGSTSGSMSTQYVEYNKAKNLTSNAFSKTGYTFAGWATSADGSVVYTNGQSVTATGNLSLYAKWTVKSCTVTFDKEGGTGGTNSTTATYGSAMPDITPPTKDHNTFGGYWDGDGGTGNQYYNADGTSYANWNKDVTTTQTLYAKWTPTTKTMAVAGVRNVTITATPAGSSATAEGSSTSVGYGITVTLNYSSLASSTQWAGWNVYLTDDGTPVAITGSGSGATFTMPDADVTVSANTYGDYRAWCPLSITGDVYVTGSKNGAIMALGEMTLEGGYLSSGASVTVTSESSDVYLSKTREPNFAKDTKPTTSLSFTANASGVISATPIYVHYKPASWGDGDPADVLVTADLATPDPTRADTCKIHVRNMPQKFVVAGKVGPSWYALPANMGNSDFATPRASVIEVDESEMTAVAPKTMTYTLWPVKTTSSGTDRYSSDGGDAGKCIRLAAISMDNKGLYAQDAASPTKIKNSTDITTLGGGGDAHTEWKITTSVTNGQWHYNLQSNQANHTTPASTKDRYLCVYKEDSLKWGTFESGATKELYFLPVTETEPFEVSVIEWYPTKMLLQTDNALSSPSVSIDGDAVASPSYTDKGTKWYEISNLPLTDKKPHTMTIKYTGADTKTYSAAIKVPIILWESQQLVNPSGDKVGGVRPLNEPFASITPDVYNYADLVVRDGATFEINGTAAQNEFYDVTIYPTSKISVPATNANSQSNKLFVHSLTFFGGIDDIYTGSGYETNKYGVPELSLKGTCGKKTQYVIDYVMRVDVTQMYSLTVPYDVKLADVTYWDGASMTPGTNLYAEAYDGAARAAKTTPTWIYETNFATKFPATQDTLKAGRGYTISAEPQYDGNPYSILRMPMKKNFAKDASEAAKSVPVTAHSSEKPNNQGWNLVGNPYMVSISGSTAGGADDTKLIVGYLVEDEGAWSLEEDDLRYVTIPKDDGTGYSQKKWSSVTLPPFKNFFVQVGTSGTLSFALASRNNMPARNRKAAVRAVSLEIQLDNGSSESDNCGLLICDTSTTAYVIPYDLEKMESDMCVYTLTGGYRLAYNAINPEYAAGGIPVGYTASAGSYTFRLDESESQMSELEHVWLTDNVEHQTVDLLAGEYAFTTGTVTNNETRFVLSTELKDESTATDIPDIEAEENYEPPMKFLYHDKLYILRGGVIYDATGKRVMEINK